MFIQYCIASLVAQMVKNLPAMQETRHQSLGWENPQEKEMTTHSGVLAWKIPWTEEPGRLQSMESQRVRHDRSDLAHTQTIFTEIDHMLCHKTSVYKFQRTEII